MRELIAEHKPHIDKMNKTGPQLLELSPVEGEPIREKYTASDQLYAKLKADVKQRAATLDEAISKSTQVQKNHSSPLQRYHLLSTQIISVSLSTFLRLSKTNRCSQNVFQFFAFPRLNPITAAGSLKHI